MAEQKTNSEEWETLMRILILAFWAAELVALAVYIRSCWPHRTRASFFIKLVCSGIFLAYGITLAVLVKRGVNVSFLHDLDTSELSAGAGTFMQFPTGGLTARVVHLIIAALAYGFIGDFFLGLAHQIGRSVDPQGEADDELRAQVKNRKTAANALGVLSFILGHVLYCVAFGRALYGYELYIRWWSVLLLLLPLIVYLFMGLQLKLGKQLLPLGIYFLAVSIMFAMAMTLGIQLWPYSRLFSICLMAGGLFFVAADLGLAVESYGGERWKRFPLRAARQVEYFTGQMLLATTILFFYTV